MPTQIRSGGAANVARPSARHLPAGASGEKLFLGIECTWRRLLVLLFAITAVRVGGLALSNAELFFDEAQYWAWAQEPAFGYHTKPPLIAWLIGATTALCGDSPFCVRLPSPFLHLATSLTLYALAAKLHSPRLGFWAALVYALMPGISVSATLMSTDAPLLLFWSLALLALVRHLERPSIAAGLALGLAIGAGLNAKYAMAYFLVSYAAYALVSAEARTTLRHPGSWAALLVAAVLIAPNLLWNAAHQFATFAHTADDAAWGGRFPNVLGLLGFIGNQAAIIGPVPFVAFLAGWRARPVGFDAEPRRLLLAMSLPVFALIATQALISKANGNWAAVGFPAAVILATAVMMAGNWRRGMIATLVIGAVALVAVSFAGVLAGTVTTGPVGRQLGKMIGWGDFAAKVRDLAEANDIRTVVFIGRAVTASMIYELRESDLDVRSYVADLAAPREHFETTRPWSAADSGPVLLVLTGDWPPPREVSARATFVGRFNAYNFIVHASGGVAVAYRVD